MLACLGHNYLQQKQAESSSNIAADCCGGVVLTKQRNLCVKSGFTVVTLSEAEQRSYMTRTCTIRRISLCSQTITLIILYYSVTVTINKCRPQDALCIVCLANLLLQCLWLKAFVRSNLDILYNLVSHLVIWPVREQHNTLKWLRFMILYKDVIKPKCT